MRILSIHAHPDDAEFLAGGTLALLSRQNHDVVIISLSAGDCGSNVHGPEELARLRIVEATSAAARIGAHYQWGGFSDLSIFNDDPSRRRVTALLRDLCPDVVLTASPSDYLCDHEATSQLVRDACFAAPVPNYRTGSRHPPLSSIPHLYFMDPLGRRDRSGHTVLPDFTIDVSSVFEIKRSMLAEHQSQRAWLQQQHRIDDYLDRMERWTRECGAPAGVLFGEGFRQYKLHPYPETGLLQQLLSRYLIIS